MNNRGENSVNTTGNDLLVIFSSFTKGAIEHTGTKNAAERNIEEDGETLHEAV